MIRLVRSLTQTLPHTHLEGPRVLLRPPRDADWRTWAELRAASRQFLEPWEPVWARDALSRAALRRRLGQAIAEWRRDSSYAFHIFSSADEVLLGGITLSNVRRGVAQTGTLGYWIGQKYARQGYMTEAIRCVMQFAFEDLRLHRLEAACLPENEASRALLIKSGFREEGYARGYLRINGNWHDHVLFGLTSENHAAGVAKPSPGTPANEPRLRGSR